MAALFSVAAACALTTCTPSVTALDKVRTTGVLRVATVNSPTSYFVGPDGATGFDYDLVSGFAKQLGVELRIEVVASAPDALELARQGKVDMAAAGLAVTPQREALVSFSPPVRSVVPQLVYRMGQKRPKSWEELEGGRLAVPSRSAQTELLATQRLQTTGLKWEEIEEGDAEDCSNRWPTAISTTRWSTRTSYRSTSATTPSCASPSPARNRSRWPGRFRNRTTTA